MREGPPPRSAVLVVHGFKGFKDWGFLPHVCSRLAVEGHAVLSFNFSHNGIGPHPEVLTELDAFAANTFTRELEELRYLLRRTREGALTPRRPRRVGLLGHSRGGADAILVAREGGVDALVTWGPVDHLDRFSSETTREWREAGVVYVLDGRTGQHLPLSLALLDDLERNRSLLDLHRAATEVESPWLIVHGKDDLTVPVQEGERLAGASGKARLHLVDGAGHAFEAGHPFQGSTPALEEALEVSVPYFGRHLETE